MRFKAVLMHVPGLPLRMEDLMPQRTLAAMASSLKRADVDVQIVDLGTPECAMAASPLAVAAITECATQEATATGLPQIAVLHIARRKDVLPARVVARRIRGEAPDCKVLITGTYAESYGDVLVREEPCFDAAILLDPELALVEAVKLMRSGSTLEGCANLVALRDGLPHRGKRSVLRSLDELPLPDYSAAVYPVLYQGMKLHLFDVEHCRGGEASQIGPTAPWTMAPLRVKSPSVCAREIDHIRHFAPSAGTFQFTGTSAPAQAVEHLCYELRGLERPVRYGRDVQISGFENLSPHSLYASGCRVLRFTIHTGSQRLLEDFYGQAFKVSEAERVLQRAQRARLTRIADFTFPVPHDDRHTRAETVRLLSRTMPEAVTVSAPELRPESTWRDWQEAYGFEVEDAAYREWVACGSDEPAAPFQMRGWNAVEVQRERSLLLHEVQDLGIYEGLSAHEGLVARVLELDEQLEQFALLQREALLQEDTADNLVRIFNERASLPTSGVTWFPFQPTLRAVSN
jgi:hypothetical protein